MKVKKRRRKGKSVRERGRDLGVEGYVKGTGNDTAGRGGGRGMGLGGKVNS